MLSSHIVLRIALPAVVGGDDHCVAHTRSSQAVSELVEKPVEQRLQRQDEQKHAHEDAAGGLQSTVMGQFIISHHAITILSHSPNYLFQAWGSGPLHEFTRQNLSGPKKISRTKCVPIIYKMPFTFLAFTKNKNKITLHLCWDLQGNQRNIQPVMRSLGLIPGGEHCLLVLFCFTFCSVQMFHLIIKVYFSVNSLF